MNRVGKISNFKPGSHMDAIGRIVEVSRDGGHASALTSGLCQCSRCGSMLLSPQAISVGYVHGIHAPEDCDLALARRIHEE